MAQSSPASQVASAPTTSAKVVSAAPAAASVVTVAANDTFEVSPPAIGFSGVQVSVPLSLSSARPDLTKSSADVVMVAADNSFDTSSATVTGVAALPVAVFATSSV